jgi:hypothetical protein
MAQRRFREDHFHDSNVYSFPREAPASYETDGALDLVYQAADAFRELQDRARDTELRAQSLCSAASERLRAAEMRAAASEQAYRELVSAVDKKLKDASRALEQAQANMREHADRRTAAEMRAQQAVAESKEAKKLLASVEEAIRNRLLVEDQPPRGRYSAA